MAVIEQLKLQIQSHPWPWLAGVFILGIIIGTAL